jgi:D-alanyl-lipoteichoic acid acyltransferase DltB (MBOAT superfamily)
MQFNSPEFIIFLPAVVIGFYILPHTWRWIWLCMAGCWFFARIPLFALPLLLTALVEYSMAILIERSRIRGSGKMGMYRAIGVIFPLALLAFFKYLPYCTQTAAGAASFFHLNFDPSAGSVILPLGISYYTLQGISYITEVKRGTMAAERHFGFFLLYFLFFPKLTAGPIERPYFLSQFHEKHCLEYENVSAGLKIIVLGLFKKLVVADRVGVIVNEVYSNASSYHGIYLMLATALFAVQIYCDFSGYTDIARGSARLMGFRLMENFKYPYGSTSLSEYWRRWHISLSTWFRDYLYIPMGGSRVGRCRWYANLFTVFIVSGFWHGSGWNFIAWGAFHGMMMMFGSATGRAREKLAHSLGIDAFPRLHRALKTATTASLVCVAWVFFRAESITRALSIVRRIACGIGDIANALFRFDSAYLASITDIARYHTILGFSRDMYRPEMLIAAASTALLWLFNFLHKRLDFWERLSGKNALLRWAFYGSLITAILLFGMFTSEQFIYFRF